MSPRERQPDNRKKIGPPSLKSLKMRKVEMLYRQDLSESPALAHGVSLPGMPTPPDPSPSRRFQFIRKAHRPCHLLCEAILSRVLCKASPVLS